MSKHISNKPNNKKGNIIINIEGDALRRAQITQQLNLKLQEMGIISFTTKKTKK